ncbi:MAG: hypothetical protein JOZ33_08050 [Acidobacteriaceae bacterium]|nr:hypothetical protein [Acidobacteriaceae bacterium]
MAHTKKPTRPRKNSVIFRGRNARLGEYEALLDRLLICVAPVGREQVAKLGRKLWRSIPHDTQLELVHDVALTVAYVAAQALAQQTQGVKR